MTIQDDIRALIDDPDLEVINYRDDTEEWTRRLGLYREWYHTYFNRTLVEDVHAAHNARRAWNRHCSIVVFKVDLMCSCLFGAACGGAGTELAPGADLRSDGPYLFDADGYSRISADRAQYPPQAVPRVVNVV